MSVLSKARKVFKRGGVHRLVSVLVSQYGLPIPLSAKFRHTDGLPSELGFWDAYFRTKGLQWADSYGIRLDPDFPLQPRPAALLPPQSEVHILDVGAGPLTYLGKKTEGKQINITAVDPLALEYDNILSKYQVIPIIRTQKLAAEELTKRFPPNSFDLVFARNCIDHSYDPQRAILQMIKVVKSGGYVLLEHTPNEADNENYDGLHQWNFSMSANGHFLIGSRSKQVDITGKFAEHCTMTCEMVVDQGDWLITRIRKR